MFLGHVGIGLMYDSSLTLQEADEDWVDQVLDEIQSEILRRCVICRLFRLSEFSFALKIGPCGSFVNLPCGVYNTKNIASLCSKDSF